MRLLKEVDKAIFEILEDIALRGQDCPAVLYLDRTDPRKIIYYAPKEVDSEDKVSFIDEVKEEMTLLEVLFEFVKAKKYGEHKSPPTQASVIITSCRLLKGLTQEQFATAIGVPVVTLRRWESSASSPSFQNMLKLIAFAGFDLKIV